MTKRDLGLGWVLNLLGLSAGARATINALIESDAAQELAEMFEDGRPELHEVPEVIGGLTITAVERQYDLVIPDDIKATIHDGFERMSAFVQAEAT